MKPTPSPFSAWHTSSDQFVVSSVTCIQLMPAYVQLWWCNSCSCWHYYWKGKEFIMFTSLLWIFLMWIYEKVQKGSNKFASSFFHDINRKCSKSEINHLLFDMFCRWKIINIHFPSGIRQWLDRMKCLWRAKLECGFGKVRVSLSNKKRLIGEHRCIEKTRKSIGERIEHHQRPRTRRKELGRGGKLSFVDSVLRFYFE